MPIVVYAGSPSRWARYRLHGKPCPGVSDVLVELGISSGDGASGALLRVVRECIAGELRGAGASIDPEDQPLIPGVVPLVEAAKRWLGLQRGFEPLEVELELEVSSSPAIMGTVALWARRNRVDPARSRFELVDWRIRESGPVEPRVSERVRLAAYLRGIDLFYPGESSWFARLNAARRIVYLMPDGTFESVELEDGSDFMLWRACLDVWKARNA